MAAAAKQKRLAGTQLKQGQVELISHSDSGSRVLLRVVILSLIAAAAISSRLFSVIREFEFEDDRYRYISCRAGSLFLLSKIDRTF